MMSKVEGIILAAGLSTRLLGGQKIWTDICGEPMISHVVRQCLASRLDHVTVVLGPADATRTELEEFARFNSRFSKVVNSRPQAGMSESIRVGLAGIDPSADGAALILGDQPLITGCVIDTLITAFKSHKNVIVAPLIRGHRSTPVIFPAALFAEVMQITGDVGARSVVNNHVEDVIGLEMGAVYDDTDLDTQDDLLRIRKKMSIRKSCL
jgi:molybdenum cofactor cytidylyltransferase